MSLSIGIRGLAMCVLTTLTSVGYADVFTCGKAAGSAIYSLEGFRVIEDGLTDNEFRIVVTASQLSFPGVASNLRTVAQTPNTISAIATPHIAHR